MMGDMLRVAQQALSKFRRVMTYPTVTIEYPYVSKPLVKLARIQLQNNFNECTACKECEKKCPVKAITIVSDEYSSQVKRPRNSKGELFEGSVSNFQIDYSRCVFCGICVEACPANSLVFDRNFVKPEMQLQHLKIDLVHIPRSMRKEES